ncbi:MAG TPA: hypothetical protein VF753_17490 [Terriglobales bacterium]
MRPSFHRYAEFLFSATVARVAGILITAVTFPYLVRVLGVTTYGKGTRMDCSGWRFRPYYAYGYRRNRG